MDQQLVHQISEKTIQLAQKHAQEAAQHGKAVEELGKSVGGALGKFIEEHGVASQRQIQEGEATLDELRQTRSTQAYTKVAEDHIKAGQAHVAATKKYLEQF